ncbi:MAG: MaoC family dehydratase [Proteobacteria bacterium]|nr:MaoC family dehydratase [Pseudomonadota bacterium]
MRQLRTGEKESIVKVFTDNDLTTFAEITCDHNPMHLDDDYVGETSFGKKIAHGMHVSALISAVVGTKLPGPGTIFLSQSMTYLAPVFVGDSITAEVEVVEIARKGFVSLNLWCRNQDGVIVIEGQASVKVPRSWTTEHLSLGLPLKN